jgi:hypothetical protein
MTSGAGSGRILDLGASVRSNTGGAALAAGLLIFFGFIYLAEPASGAGASVLFHTLRFGGLAMVVVSVWLSFGHLPALAADAAVSILIGALIAFSGAVMLISGYWWVNSLVILVSGGTFLTGGLRNGRDFLDMWRLETAVDKDDEEDLAALSAAADSPLADDLARGQTALQAKSRAKDDPDLVDMESTGRPKRGSKGAGADQPLQLDGLSPEPPPSKTPGSPPNSSESYLAKLAKKDKSADR